MHIGVVASVPLLLPQNLVLQEELALALAGFLGLERSELLRAAPVNTQQQGVRYLIISKLMPLLIRA
jgi:hypothetical protein